MGCRGHPARATAFLDARAEPDMLTTAFDCERVVVSVMRWLPLDERARCATVSRRGACLKPRIYLSGCALHNSCTWEIYLYLYLYII